MSVFKIVMFVHVVCYYTQYDISQSTIIINFDHPYVHL